MHSVAILVPCLPLIPLLDCLVIPEIWQTTPSSVRDSSMNTNVTFQEMASAMRNLGYNVREFPGERPMAFRGDIAFNPEQIIPELSESRDIVLNANKIWKNNGIAQCWYYYDESTSPDKALFEDAVKTWSDKTCIQLNKIQGSSCNQKFDHGAICVGSFSGCWSYIGQQGNTQKMSVQKNGCELVAAAHEVGHSLGLEHQQSRNDRDKYIHVNYENFKTKITQDKSDNLASRWAQGGRCAKDQTLNIPVPYDYMSLMHYRTSSFTDIDSRAVFVTKDGHFQYILDYHRPAGMTQSDYDLYSINTVYGCDKTWAKACQSNGYHPPKCTNFGYVAKNCKCRCPKGFTGASCETKAGSLYPLLAKAKTMLDVRKTTLVTFKGKPMSPQKLDGIVDDFKYYQYITLIVDGISTESQASVRVMQNMRRVRQLRQMHNIVMDHIEVLDCSGGLVLMWGISALGQIRTECLSSLINNEPEGPWFRSKTNHLDLTAYSYGGMIWSSPRGTMQIFESMQMQVLFASRPDKKLKVKKSQDPSDNSSIAQASRMLGPTGRAGIGVGIAILLLLLLFCSSLAALGFWRKIKREDLKDPKALIRKLRGGHGSDSDEEVEAEDNNTESESEEMSRENSNEKLSES